MDYNWGDPFQPWSWRKMLKGMTQDLRNRIFGKVGVVGFWLVPLPGSYDHKRQTTAKKIPRPFPDGAPVPLWDFVVLNAEGGAFRIHTNSNDNKISIDEFGEGNLHNYPMAGPKKGPGLSDGPGTYKKSSA